METEREVDCFVYDYRPLVARIRVDRRTDGRQLVWCPIRQGAYILTPEEHIRQAIVWFLLEGTSASERWRRLLRVQVEQSSLDVALYVSETITGRQFRPRIPVVIIETKRPELALDPNSAQLKRYLDREGCSAGLLFNGRSAVWMVSKGPSIAPDVFAMQDMRDVEARIETAASAAVALAGNHRSAFGRASEGDFAAACMIVNAFGRDTGLTFALSIKVKGSLGKIEAYALQVVDNGCLTYRLRGVGSRNRVKLFSADFHALLSVLPL